MTNKEDRRLRHSCIGMALDLGEVREDVVAVAAIFYEFIVNGKAVKDGAEVVKFPSLVRISETPLSDNVP